ncbi:type II toxin-antitoxin system VapC family toxin [Deferrisoma camini]|uniref:type II toxin-antitoxin system VapC family toxin n=1 Tax=Deferrisoma camini TaxID=1035120 RepID=UPI00046D07FB|nr:type II toxin-antitoxin system VapC family toxin [Deferrisoma camini]
MPFVLDCSVTMAWVFPDEASDTTDRLRDSLLDDTAVVPALWPAEVGNVLLVATRRGRINRCDWGRIAADLAALPIVVDRIPPDDVLTAVVPLADKCGLSVYDGMYLELALRRDLPLATLDKRLAEACLASGGRLT